MTDLRTAAQQALEALEKVGFADARRGCDEAVGILRVALAQQDEPVEPVAWMVYTEGGASAYVTDNPRDLIGAYRALALYTTPPQRKPLTEEEIDNICRQAHGGADPQEWARNFARAVERAHGIGETK